MVLLFAHTLKLSAVVNHIREVATRQNSILMFLVVFLYIKVDAAITLIGITVLKDFLDKFFLLDDVTSRMRFNRRRQHIEGIHGCMIAVGVVLCYLHRLQLFESCFLFYFVIALICIVFQMAHIGDIAHIAHLIPKMFQVAEKDIEGDCRACVPQMWVAIDGRATYIHAHVRRMQRFEQLFLTCKCIVNDEILLHILNGL